MERVSIDDVDSYMGPADVKRPLTDALGATDLAINYYELDSGESFAFGRHRHAEQEEVFYVQQGTVTVEAGDPDAEPETVTVEAGELIRFGPGEWQRGVNEGEERVVALALGAPQKTGETTVTRECPDCGERTETTIEMTDDRDALVTRCVECGTESGRFT
jgi:mannose-6-phosphate isomerase-like protein (cupin superfamily)